MNNAIYLLVFWVAYTVGDFSPHTKNTDQVMEQDDTKSERKQKEKERQQAKEELRKVQEHLKRMGMGAFRTDVCREGQQLIFVDGRKAKVISSSHDRERSLRLQDLFIKARDYDRKCLQREPPCSDGYETCIDGRWYIALMEPLTDGNCTGSWLLTDLECH